MKGVALAMVLAATGFGVLAIVAGLIHTGIDGQLGMGVFAFGTLVTVVSLLAGSGHRVRMATPMGDLGAEPARATVPAVTGSAGDHEAVGSREETLN